MTEAIKQMNGETQQIYNTDYVNDSAIKIRLDTENTLTKIEIFLRGQKINYYQDPTGEIVSQQVTFGSPKANEQGIQNILGYLQGIFNASVVQGNYKFQEDYYNDMAQIREDLTETFMLNAQKWDLIETEMGGIVDMLMSMIKPFMSRLIDNKERESYNNTIRSVQSQNVKDNNQFKE
jgi:hypothetical protein